MNAHEICTRLRAGKYAWPGGYPIYFVASDGEPLSFEAVRDNLRAVLWAARGPHHDRQWRVEGVDINWEDESLFCVHTGRKIESAYGEEN